MAGFLPGFKNRIPLTIDSTKVGSDISYFPLDIDMSASGLSDVFSKVGSHYEKIAISKEDGTTRLFVNVQRWESDSNDGWIVVGIPDVSSSSDTKIYLYYDEDADDQRWHPSPTDLSDDFTGVDGDPPDILKWRVCKGNPTIQSNRLSISVSSSNRRNRIILKSVLWGDFDIQVKGHLDSTPSTNWWVMNLVLHFPDRGGHWCYVGRGYDSTIGQQFIKSRYNKGTSTNLDWDNVTDTDFTLRLVREGDLTRYYYKTTGDWISLGEITMYSDSAVVALEFSCGGDYPSVSGYFEDFVVSSCERASGYVGRAGSYMASGVWDNDFLLATSMVDSFDLYTYLTKSSNYGNQGLAADGTYFYWGKDNGAGVDGTIYKFEYDGTDVTSFSGPPHAAGGDIHEDNDTLLFCSGGSEPYEVWEITKTGTKQQEWDLSSVDYGEGGEIAYKEGNTIYVFTSETTSPYAFKVREVTLHSDGTYTLGNVWSHSGVGIPQGMDYVDGRLFLLADNGSQVSIFELLLRDDGTIDTVEYKTNISEEGEGFAWDGDRFFFGTHDTGKIYTIEDLVDIHNFKYKTQYLRDELLTEERKILTKKGANEPQETTSSFAGGQNFDGTDDYISIGNDKGYLDILGDSDFTVEALVKTDDTTTWSTIYGARTSGETPTIHFRKDSSNYLRLWKQDDGGDDVQAISTTTIADNNDHYVVGVLDDYTINLYIDASSDGTDANSAVGSADLSSVGHIIGRKYSDAGDDYWEDLIALLRISKTARSSDWISTVKESLFNNLITIGTIESFLQNIIAWQIGLETSSQTIAWKVNLQQMLRELAWKIHFSLYKDFSFLNTISLKVLYNIKNLIQSIKFYNVKNSIIYILYRNLVNHIIEDKLRLMNLLNKLGYDPVEKYYDLINSLNFDEILILTTLLNSIDEKTFKTIDIINYIGDELKKNIKIINDILSINPLLKDYSLITTLGKSDPLHLGDFDLVADEGASASTGDFDIFLDGQSIKDSVENISITLSENYFTNSFDAEISDLSLWSLLEPDGSETLRIHIKIGIDDYYFLLEKREFSASFGKRVIKIWGRSKTAILSEPYSTKLTDQYLSSGVASDVIANLASGFTLEYNIFDYFIPENTFEIAGKTKIQVIDAIAKAGGGIVRCGKQGELIIRYKYPYNPDEIESETTDYDFDYYDNIISLSESEIQESGYNAVLVETDTSTKQESNVSGTIVLDPDKTPPSPTLGDAIYFRVYLTAIPDYNESGYPDSFYEFRTTDGSLTYQGTITEEITEEVEIVSSKGTTQYPILNIVSYSWIGLNPGTITVDPERENTLKLTPSGDRTEGIVSITYNTAYDLWYAQDLDEDSVLFVIAKEV